MANVRFILSFNNQAEERITAEVWQWAEPSHQPLYEWLTRRFVALHGAPLTVKKIKINQAAVRPIRLWVYPLAGLRDGDVVEVTMEELTLQKG